MSLSRTRSVDHVEALDTSELDPDTLLREGVALCRDNRWKEGVVYLAAVANIQPRPHALPSHYYGLLGHGLARVQRRIDEGIALCRRAVREGFGDAENHILLVRTLWLAKRRREAIAALQEGLSLATDPAPLLRLHQEIERRRPPVISIFSRDHAVNRLLGKITYRA